MPIDDAMRYELVDAWLPKAAIAEAEKYVLESYRAQAENDTGMNKLYDGIAADVIAVLWGVASYIQESTCPRDGSTT